jgi:pyridoxamine 5'-phosphate oxidase
MINNKSLSEKEVDLNPFVQFDIWYKKHLTSGIAIPNTVSLGTAFADGRISVRTVLLKDYDENGFIFFTGYNSRKGSQLSSNPSAALLFYWPDSGRQVRIEGFAEKISEEESESYFKIRPRESQLSAWASEQSTGIPDRQYLERRYDLYKNKFNGKPVEKPRYWGGFRIVPGWFEFWQEREFRLHDRLTYTKRQDVWIIGRLAP